MAQRLFGRLFVPILGVAFIAVVSFGASALFIMDGLYAASNSEGMSAAVKALAASFPAEAPLSPGPKAEDWCAAVSKASGYRVTLVSADGSVVADSEASPEAMENHSGRPEFAAALAGRTTTARRSSATLGSLLFYAAAPLRDGEVVLGAIRIAARVPALEERLKPARALLTLMAMAVLAASIAAAAFFSRRLSFPLASLAEATREVASGGLERPIPEVPGPEEIRQLSFDIASMARELRERLEEAETEGREKAAILDGMAEAVLALDARLDLRMANASARALFGLGEGEPGRQLSLLGVTHSTELQAMAERCLAAGSPIEAEVSVYGKAETSFRAFAAPLGGKVGEPGAVIVLDDITERKRLERVRRDFVANVSHELRTPIQLIKGFTEALADGGLDDRPRAERFLGIMSRNASRMESLVDDLLTLARLEQDGGVGLRLEELEVGSLLEEAISAVGPKAESRRILIAVKCPEGLRAKLNGGLFVQGIVNLLDNAVKYSPEGSRVKVKASLETRPGKEGKGEAGLLVVKVSDRGMGIPAGDLPRIFERFYRVDKARSRELGGTGLGLAIVRHIALAHGGTVSVESFEGEGSTFTMSFPQSAMPDADQPEAPA